MRKIVAALCICAGARQDVLKRVRDGRGQTATLGLILILVGIISALTSGYALNRAFLGDRYAAVIAVVGGLVWATLVFCIDRLMILSFDKAGSALKLTGQVLMRVPLAVIIAAVMSTPFILRLSESVTDAELRKESRDTVEQEFSANSKEAGLAERHASVIDLTTVRQKHEDNLRAEPSSFEYTEAKLEAQRSRANYQSIQSANTARVTRANTEINQITRRTPDGNLGPVEISRITALQQSIQSWQTETATAKRAMDAADSKLADAIGTWQSAEAESLKQTTKDLTLAVAAANDAEVKVGARNQDSENSTTPLFRSTLINQYRTYQRVTSNPKHPDYAAMKSFELGMHLLFFILELTPIAMKAMCRKGPMDDALAAVEQLDSDRINGDANNDMARRQAIVAAKRAIEDAAIESWCDSTIAKFRAGELQSTDLNKLSEELETIAT